MFDEIDDQQFRQMDRSLRVFRSAAVQMQRPRQGWLRAIRDVLGIPAREVAETLKSSRQLPVGFEQAEAEDRITLKSLRRAADAIGFELVYALVPKVGTLGAVVEARGRAYPRKPPKVVNARRNRATG